MSNELMIFETKKERAEIKLRQQINSIRNSLNTLESRLDSNEGLFKSDGLQGSGLSIDNLVIEIASYDRAIELFKRSLEKK